MNDHDDLSSRGYPHGPGKDMDCRLCRELVENELDPLPQDGTLALLYMILRKAEINIDRDHEGGISIWYRTKDRRRGDFYLHDRNDWPQKIGDDLKALLNQVWEEVNR